METTHSPKAAHQAAISTSGSWWNRQKLRTKATLLATALGTLPVIATGTLAFFATSPAIKKEVISQQETRVSKASELTSRFIFERYGDIQIMSNLPIFANRKGTANVTEAQKQGILDKYVKVYGVYDSIAEFDLNGNVLVQNTGSPLSNHKDRSYFQEVLKTQKPLISQPEYSKSTKEFVIHFAAPVFDAETGKIIAIVRSRMPVQYLSKAVENKGYQVFLVNRDKKYFIANKPEEIGLKADEDFTIFSRLYNTKKTATEVYFNSKENIEELVTYSPVETLKGLPELDWSVLVATETKTAFEATYALEFALIAGTAVASILVAALAAYLANLAVQPIINSAETVKKIGQGDFDTRLNVFGQDELATLGSNINLMAEQIQTSLLEQQKLAQAQLESQAEIARQQTEATQAQLESQAEIVRQQTEAAETERQRSQALQMELLELLQNVGGASEGDLTVRADVSAGEIGIVADFFNSIVESLRDIVSQVKLSAGQVNTSVGSNEVVMGQLADQAQSQAHKITDTLKSVEQMVLSIQQVADNARQASKVSGLASKTAESGGETIDRTVESILQLRDTVAETAKKVKRLGESSQQISKVVSLINQIALQTNLLAINASIEAARAGEEGRGFAVVAEEVGALAAQSAAATKEIEGIVDAIQRETSEVVDAMENGTTQVVEGTRQVNEAKESLNQIVKVSREIDDLLKSISSATVSQTETSQVVKLLMEQITESSEQTSTTSRQVSSSLQETVAIAQQLQASVGTFKLEE